MRPQTTALCLTMQVAKTPSIGFAHQSLEKSSISE
jgi:hypothetical protein